MLLTARLCVGAFGPFLTDNSAPAWQDARAAGIYGRVRVGVRCTCLHIGVGGVLPAINHPSYGCRGACGRDGVLACLSMTRRSAFQGGFKECLLLLQGVTHTHTHLPKNASSYVIMDAVMRLSDYKASCQPEKILHFPPNLRERS